MGNKLFEIENLKCDFDFLQNKISDLVESNFYVLEDYFEDEQLEDMKAVERFGFSYRELRIKTNQSQELLLLYKNEMAKLLLELDEEIDKLKAGDTNA